MEESGLSRQASRSGQQSDSIELTRMLRAQENTRALFKVLTRPYNSPSYLKWIITQTFASTTDLQAWLKRIDDYVNGKIEIPGHSGYTYSDPYQDQAFITELQNTLLKEWAELSKEFDATSRVAMRDYIISGFKLPYKILNPTFFVSWISDGKLLLLTGEKDSGKSDWSCRLAQMAMPSGVRVLGNIEMRYDVAGYTYCRKFSDMIRQICDAKLLGQNSLVIIDEAGLEFASYDATTRGWKAFDKFAKLTRKFRTNQIFIIQYENQVPFTLRQHYTVWHHKYDTKTECRIEIRSGPHKGFDYVIGGIPRTDLPYETEHIAGMLVDVNISDMLQFLERLPQHANQFEEIRNYVSSDRVITGDEFSQREKEFLAYKLKRVTEDKPETKKLTDKDIGKVLGMSTAKVRKVIKGVEDSLR